MATGSPPILRHPATIRPAARVDLLRVRQQRSAGQERSQRAQVRGPRCRYPCRPGRLHQSQSRLSPHSQVPALNFSPLGRGLETLDAFQGFARRDFISLFLDYTESTISPDVFRRWCGISLLAGALERRCWVRVGRYQTYPNLYTVFVARPGVGKYIIEEVGELWRDTCRPGSEAKAFHVAPSNMTKAALLDRLALAVQRQDGPEGTPPHITHPMLVAAEEMGVLLPKYDGEFISVLNRIWNNPPIHEETRRTGKVQELSITFPQLNLLAGVQPGWLSCNLPDDAWTTGLTSRMMLIYAADPPDKDIFAEESGEAELRRQLLDHLGGLSTLKGEWRFSASGIERLRLWGRYGPPPIPTHSKLEHYVPRRTLHLIKLALVACVARDPLTRTIQAADLDRGLEWLLEAEALMPDIFRAMKGKSDSEVIEELHYHLTSLTALSGKPIHSSRVWDFLRDRVPSERIPRVIDTAVNSDIIAVCPDGSYQPRAKFNHRGIE